MQDAYFNAPYLRTLDGIENAEVYLRRHNRLDALKAAIDKQWPKGHPTQFIHVAGSSGKGSVVKFLEAGLSQLGKAGSSTSPHVFDYRERFSVNGHPVTATELTAAWEHVVYPLLRHTHTTTGITLNYGDIRLLLTLALFDHAGVKYGVYEAAVGGQFDAGMVLDVIGCVVTTVGDDHRDILGEHLWQRATEKASLARPKKPLFTGILPAIAQQAAEQIASHTGSPLHSLTDAKLKKVRTEIKTELKTAKVKLKPSSPLLSPHQQANTAVALMALTLLHPQIDRARMIIDIAKLKHTGRFHQIEERLFADIAHNPDKIKALVTDVQTRFKGQKVGYIVGLSGGRDGSDVLGPVLETAQKIIITTPAYKGVPASLLAASLSAINSRDIELIVEDDPTLAAAHLRALINKGELDVGIVTGSAYLIDQAFNPNPYVASMNAIANWR